MAVPQVAELVGDREPDRADFDEPMRDHDASTITGAFELAIAVRPELRGAAGEESAGAT